MHWQNSHFQILAFVAGSCHTFDEAYRVCRQQREDRECAIFQARSQPGFDRLIAAAPEELNPVERATLACYRAACAERDFYDELIARIAPHRKYAHLPDEEAFQACQREEWCLRFKTRAENYLLSQGFIPPEQLEAMRLHPDFAAEIEPHIRRLIAAPKSTLAPLETPLTKLLLPAPETKMRAVT